MSTIGFIFASIIKLEHKQTKSQFMPRKWKATHFWWPDCQLKSYKMVHPKYSSGQQFNFYGKPVNKIY